MSNLRAFLSAIAWSEGTLQVPNSDDGYRVIVGGKLFDNYEDHPRVRVEYQPGKYSTAAGRYQILEGIYDFYRLSLMLPDFSPPSQDRIATQLIRECGALSDVVTGHFDAAVYACRSRWASLPGAGYSQPERELMALRGAFLNAGGVLT